MRSARADPLLNARATVATLQSALDAAHERIRGDARVIAELNARLAEQTECRDAAELRLAALREREPAA